MFKKIKDFFLGNKPAPAEQKQEVPLTPVDVAIKNIKETTESVTAKVEVAPVEVTTPVAEATPEPAKEQAWTKNPPAAIAKRAPRQQSAKATTAPKKKKPAAK
jgi:hypothetical protein